MRGRHGLVSFEYSSPLRVVAEVSQSFCLDNGAFSKWKSGRGAVDELKYMEWVAEVAHHPGLDFAIIPDVIDGTEEQNHELVIKWVRSGMNVTGAPVWHLHESLQYLAWLVSNFRVVCFGSSGEYSQPGNKAWFRRMDEAMTVACDDQGRPRKWFHGLRMLDPEIFTRFPFRSADSTNAGVNAGSLTRFGSYVPASAGARAIVIAERVEAFNSPAVYSKVPQMEMSLCLEDV
jgi:hypothetical protein